jgi:hypothetical protein
MTATPSHWRRMTDHAQARLLETAATADGLGFTAFGEKDLFQSILAGGLQAYEPLDFCPVGHKDPARRFVSGLRDFNSEGEAPLGWVDRG